MMPDRGREQAMACQPSGTITGPSQEVLRKQSPASNIINSAVGASYISSFVFSIFAILPNEKT
jgi:hypothetical protein